jgi:hypothetical protein
MEFVAWARARLQSTQKWSTTRDEYNVGVDAYNRQDYAGGGALH